MRAMPAGSDEHDATFGEITRAILSTLQGLRDDRGGPFKDIVRTASDRPERDVAPHVAGLPAILFPPGTERYEVESLGTSGIGPGNTLVEHHRYFLGTSLFRVYVVARILAATEPDPDNLETVALEDLIDLVMAPLAGLFIPGLYLGERLVPLDSDIVSLTRGQYVHRLRFTARRVISARDMPDYSRPFHGVEGDVHLDGGNDFVDPFKADL